jgi:hypothetical protein
MTAAPKSAALDELATEEGAISIKVSWLKQKLDEEKKQPMLEFDEQQASHLSSVGG